MSKRNLSDTELDEINEQMRSLRKKLKKLKQTAFEEIRKPPNVATVTKTQAHSEDKENGETQTGKRSNCFTSINESDSKQKNTTSLEGIQKEIYVAGSCSKEIRENLCLKAEPVESTDIIWYPELIAE
ncbi:hypothetical protein ACFW04_013964 [Cataglyphis niger]